MSEHIEIDGILIEHDDSGVGHCWRVATEDNCPSNIREEIAAEIIDGRIVTIDDYVATNGQHYRWGVC